MPKTRPPAKKIEKKEFLIKKSTLTIGPGPFKKKFLFHLSPVSCIKKRTNILMPHTFYTKSKKTRNLYFLYKMFYQNSRFLYQINFFLRRPENQKALNCTSNKQMYKSRHFLFILTYALLHLCPFIVHYINAERTKQMEPIIRSKVKLFSKSEN